MSKKPPVPPVRHIPVSKPSAAALNTAPAATKGASSFVPPTPAATAFVAPPNVTQAASAFASSATSEPPDMTREEIGEVIAAAMQHPPHYAFIKRTDELASLIEDGLVETNEAFTDESGNISARLTADGLGYFKPEVDADTAARANGSDDDTIKHMKSVGEKKPRKARAAAVSVTLDDNVPLPPSGFGTRESKSAWPFSTMAINQSFFVPPTEDRPEPHRALGSAVSQSNKRFAPKRFTMRSSTENGVKGARIWRVEDEEPDASDAGSKDAPAS